MSAGICSCCTGAPHARICPAVLAQPAESFCCCSIIAAEWQITQLASTISRPGAAARLATAALSASAMARVSAVGGTGGGGVDDRLAQQR